ncbi:MAG: asparaginase domain-containing protein [Patescibacteria group bacterium]|jgi:L-asparaginase
MSKQKSTIHFIITGGTIDSHYDASKDTAVPNEISVIPSFINGLKIYHGAEFTTVCMKDSRDLKREDLDNILKIIENSAHTEIIVTHGTYTMPDTARFLKANLKRNDQTIVLTASAVPISGFSPSDGPFNLGYAVAQLEHLKPGIYVAINGKVFSPEEVMKIISEARFASIFEKGK